MQEENRDGVQSECVFPGNTSRQLAPELAVRWDDTEDPSSSVLELQQWINGLRFGGHQRGGNVSGKLGDPYHSSTWQIKVKSSMHPLQEGGGGHRRPLSREEEEGEALRGATWGVGANVSGFKLLPPPLTNCVTLSKLIDVSVSQFSHP